jgi:hypothetical protein
VYWELLSAKTEAGSAAQPAGAVSHWLSAVVVFPGVALAMALLAVAVRRSRVTSSDMTGRRQMMGVGGYSRWIRSPLASMAPAAPPIASVSLLPQVAGCDGV